MANGETKEAAPDPVSAIRPATVAWQPLTPRGVAAFANAPFGRLFVVELVVALLAAGAVLFFLSHAWFPAIRAAIHALPETGAIRNGELVSPRASSEPLADGRALAFAVDTEGAGHAASVADIRVEFHKTNFQICSLFGCATFAYPKEWNVEFSRTERESWWGAWEPNLLWMAAVGVIAFVFVCWTLLATFYFLPVYLLAWFKDRELTLGGSWRLASAALLPGALLFIAGIFLYALGVIDLLRFLGLAALHLVVPWVYLITAPLTLPRAAEVAGKKVNPFAAASPDDTAPKPEGGSGTV